MCWSLNPESETARANSAISSARSRNLCAARRPLFFLATPMKVLLGSATSPPGGRSRGRRSSSRPLRVNTRVSHRYTSGLASECGWRSLAPSLDPQRQGANAVPPSGVPLGIRAGVPRALPCGLSDRASTGAAVLGGRSLETCRSDRPCRPSIRARGDRGLGGAGWGGSASAWDQRACRRASRLDRP
jgi:hypothetical protein